MLWRFIQELEAKLAHPARPSLHEVQQAGLHLDAGAVPMQMKRASVQLQQKLANRPDAAELAESGILDDPHAPVTRRGIAAAGSCVAWRHAALISTCSAAPVATDSPALWNATLPTQRDWLTQWQLCMLSGG